MRFSDLYAEMTTLQREELARSVETDPGYLWQLATRWRGKKPSLEFMQKLERADARLTLGELAQEFSEPVAGQSKVA